MSNITQISSEEEFTEFLEHHQNEIIGLYRDTYFRNGGWNGMMDALSEVEKRYGVSVDFAEIDNYEKLINKLLFR